METHNCQNCKSDFVIDEDDLLFYQKMQVPKPTFCPFCRHIRRSALISESALYKGTCARCKKSLITMHHQDDGYTIYCPKCKHGENWDGREYGRDYDFSKNFFEQFFKMFKETPVISMEQTETNGEGCEYSNYISGSKNSYLSYGIHGSENIFYSKYVFRGTKNCVDCLLIKKNDRCYENVRSYANYDCKFLLESHECVSSAFLYDCINCANCFMSSNLRNKSYVFRNKQLTKEEYTKELASLNLNTYHEQTTAKKEFSNLMLSSIHKYADIKNSSGCTGDFIRHSNNCIKCFGVLDSENLRNSYIILNTASENSHDIMFTGQVSDCYEVVYGGKAMTNIKFTKSCGGGSQNLEYSANCRNCKDCFGCFGLMRNQYCILNKQYTKEEYDELVPKIKKHMDEMPYVDKLGRIYKYGEYFPTELSPFAYNETLAFEEAPLTKEKALAEGYRWRDMDAKSYPATILSKDLPDSIVDVQDSILNEVIACPNNGDPKTRCTSAFKIIPDELAFYRLMKLPIPRYCPNCRYYDRLKWKNPFKFWHRKCMNQNCSNEFETSYAPERPEIVFCESCYQKEVL